MNNITADWLQAAADDLAAIEVMLPNEQLTNIIAFHAQQAVEKMLKGLIVNQGEQPPRTHKTADLLPRVSSVDLSAQTHGLLRLDRFYIPTRYPDALPGMLSEGMPNADDAMEAVQMAYELKIALSKMLSPS